MPWKKWFPEDQRVQFIVEATQGPSSVADLCRAFGVSRKTGFKWLRRYDGFGASGLVDQSRAPHTHPNSVPEELADRLVGLRRAHPTWGPRKVLAALRNLEPKLELPAASTVGELFKRHNLVTPRPPGRRRSPPMTDPFGSCTEPNDVWCTDFKGYFRTRDGARCDPLTLTDAVSRYLLRCYAVKRTDEANVRLVFTSAFAEFGLPLAIRSDNGTPFASAGAGGLTRLSIWWVRLGIRPERIEPGHPEQNGRHERMHRTLKDETARPPRQTLRAQQLAFDRFRKEYNEERPHEALNQHPPATVYRPSPRSLPAKLPDLEYPAHWELRHVKLGGEIKWKGRMVYVNSALASEVVGIEEVSEATHVVRFGPIELGRIKDDLPHLGLIWPRRPKKR
jgi:transposase InsO family protein